MNEAAQRTIARLRSQRFAGTKPKRIKLGKRLPRQASPTGLAREYGAALAALVSRNVIREAFAELLYELPDLLASARRERGDGLTALLGTAAIVANLNPTDRVYAWLVARHDAAMVRMDADEGKRARALIAKARERLRSAVSTQAIEQLAEKFAERTSTYQRIQLNRQTKSVLGADIFTGDRALRARVAGFATENVSLIKGAVEEGIATKVEKMVTRALTNATLHPNLAEQLEETFGYGEKRAKLIARDQIGKFYGQINASRQKELGVTRFVWNASNDDRTRDEHREWDGKIFRYDDPPINDRGEAVLPGEDILCRCWAEPYLDDLLAEV